MVVIVSGGRHFDDRRFVYMVLDQLHAKHHFTLVRHGDAWGVDSLADDWAVSRGLPVDPCPANWDYYGKRAGHVRNGEMLVKEPLPELVVSFPGGPGTMNMRDQARRAKVALCVVSKKEKRSVAVI